MLAKLKGVNGPELHGDGRQRLGRQRRRLRAAARFRAAAGRYGLTPRARVVAMATAGVAPRIMGFGPAPAVRKVLAKPA
jgi:acetyl-CoA acyltransferase